MIESAAPPSTKCRCRSKTSAAPRIPKSAPDAPTVGVASDVPNSSYFPKRSAPAAPPGSRGVDEREAPAPDRLLDRRADPPEKEHVEPEVEAARMQERGRDEPPPLALRDADEVPILDADADQGALVEDLAARRAERSTAVASIST